MAKSDQTMKRRSALRFQQFNLFVDRTMCGLTRAEALVWLCLFRDARDDLAQVPQSSLATRANVSVRAVKTAVARLAEKRLIKVVYRGSRGGMPSRYLVSPVP